EPDAPDRGAVQTAAPAVPPLRWKPPPTWTLLPPEHGTPRKAVYKTPKAGDAKAEAEVEVDFFGTGAPGDVEKTFGAWRAQFDAGDAGAPVRAPLEGARFPAETIEAAGKYAVAIGPQMGRAKKSAMQMVREHYRLLGAVVKTPDRGNWFFKMTGPEDSVQAARSAFLAMVRAAE
ncbi:MAG TPA: hypothetical protein VHB21_23070, partial [Minicystis sp.]|nr:hypothetical protein [Minicystis sp.]